MLSREDLLLIETINDIKFYYSLSVPLITISCSLVIFLVLFLQTRKEENAAVLNFKWQYGIGIIFSLNMILNDEFVSDTLFGFDFTQNVPDYVCKIHIVLKKYIYCMPLWIQVVYSYMLIICLFFNYLIKEI